jgi:hypothetical protein
MMDDGTLGVVGYGDPVANGRAIDTGEPVPQAARELAEPGITAEQVINPSTIGGNPGWNETRAGTFQGIELGCEKRSKSEFFKFERNQRLAPV